MLSWDVLLGGLRRIDWELSSEVALGSFGLCFFFIVTSASTYMWSFIPLVGDCGLCICCSGAYMWGDMLFQFWNFLGRLVCVRLC